MAKEQIGIYIPQGHRVLDRAITKLCCDIAVMIGLLVMCFALWVRDLLLFWRLLSLNS